MSCITNHVDEKSYISKFIHEFIHCYNDKTDAIKKFYATQYQGILSKFPQNYPKLNNEQEELMEVANVIIKKAEAISAVVKNVVNMDVYVKKINEPLTEVMSQYTTSSVDTSSLTDTVKSAIEQAFISFLDEIIPCICSTVAFKEKDAIKAKSKIVLGAANYSEETKEILTGQKGQEAYEFLCDFFKQYQEIIYNESGLTLPVSIVNGIAAVKTSYERLQLQEKDKTSGLKEEHKENQQLLYSKQQQYERPKQDNSLWRSKFSPINKQLEQKKEPKKQNCLIF